MSNELMAPEGNEVENNENGAAGEEVKFPDGTSRSFGKRAKSLKAVDTENRTVTFYVKNGQMIVVELDKISEANQLRLALHGISQKVGDDAAGIDEPDDVAVALESMRDRLYGGEWSAERTKGEFSGVSDLVKAIVEVTGKAVESVREGVKKMSAQEKAAVKANTRVKAVLDRLEAERLAKKGAVDSDALLAQF